MMCCIAAPRPIPCRTAVPLYRTNRRTLGAGSRATLTRAGRSTWAVGGCHLTSSGRIALRCLPAKDRIQHSAFRTLKYVPASVFHVPSMSCAPPPFPFFQFNSVFSRFFFCFPGVAAAINDALDAEFPEEMGGC